MALTVASVDGDELRLNLNEALKAMI